MFVETGAPLKALGSGVFSTNVVLRQPINDKTFSIFNIFHEDTRLSFCCILYYKSSDLLFLFTFQTNIMIYCIENNLVCRLIGVEKAFYNLSILRYFIHNDILLYI